jgi:hypothetical protein
VPCRLPAGRGPVPESVPMAFSGERTIVVRVTDERTRVVVADDDVLLASAAQRGDALSVM